MKIEKNTTNKYMKISANSRKHIALETDLNNNRSEILETILTLDILLVLFTDKGFILLS